MPHGDSSAVRHRKLSTYHISGRFPRARGTAVLVFPGQNDFGEPRPGRERKATVPLDIQQDIREMDAHGIPGARVSRELGVSRNTVAKYADMADMPPLTLVSGEWASSGRRCTRRYILHFLAGSFFSLAETRHRVSRPAGPR